MATKEGLFTAKLKGEFYWDLYIDIDNAASKGSIKRAEGKEETVSLSYNNMVKSVNSSTEGMELGLGEGGTFDVIKLEAKGSLSTKATSEYESIADSKVESTKTTKKSDTIAIEGDARITLYRLAFKGPGVSYTTDIISTNPSAVIEVPIEVKGRLIPVLKDIEVVYTSDSISRPDDIIQMARGDEPDINHEWNLYCIALKNQPPFFPFPIVQHEFAVSYVWLRPIWTTDVSEGVTGIQFVRQPKPNDSYKDLAKGSGGDYRYLKMIRDPHSKQRITEVALWRRPNFSNKLQGWSEELPTGEYKFSADINQGREVKEISSSFPDIVFPFMEVPFRELYLLWNTRELQ